MMMIYDDDDDDDCPLILHQKRSMHSMLVAPGRGGIKITKLNKSIADFREREKKDLRGRSGGGCREGVGVGMSLEL